MKVYRALNVGATMDQIHDDCIINGFDEDEIFLAIKAGQNLHDAALIQIEELSKRPAPFGRTK